MKLAFTILAALSALLFIVFYGRIIITAFRHHVITGLISFVPALNLLILPSIWDKIGRSFVASVMCLAIAISTWHFGGRSYLQQNNLLPVKQEVAQTAEETEAEPQPEVKNEPEELSDDIKEIRLPDKPIHYLVFVDTPKEKYSELANNDLRITLVDNSVIEGRSAETSAESISIEHYNNPHRLQEEGASRIQKVKIANIKSLQTLTIQ